MFSHYLAISDTLIPYLIFAVVLLTARCTRKPWLMLTVMVVFSCIRFDVGWDYMFYYNASADDPDTNLFARHCGWLWMQAFRLFHAMGTPWLTHVVAGGSTLGIFYFGARNLAQSRSGLCNALLFYALWPTLYLTSFSTLRQSMAVAMVLLIVAFIVKRRLFAAALLIVLNLFIHDTSVAAWPIYLLFLLQRQMNWRYLLTFSILFIVAVLSVRLWGLHSGVPSIVNYARYLDSTDNYGIKLFITNAMLAGGIVATLKLRGGEENGITRNSIYISLGGVICLLILIALRTSPPVWRVTEYYTVFLSLSLFPLIDMWPCKKLLRGAAATGLTLHFILFLWNSTRGNEIVSSPYVPYKTLIHSTHRTSPTADGAEISATMPIPQE